MEENEIQVIVGASTSVIGLGVLLLRHLRDKSSIPRLLCIDRKILREAYMNSVLEVSDIYCVGIIRLRPDAFFSLCDIMKNHGLLVASSGISIKEQIFIFLLIVGHNERFRVIGGSLYRSTKTIHQCFKVVIRTILNLHKHVIKLPDGTTPTEIENNGRYFSYFKDCIGALDGTHIRASIPVHMQGRFRGRKGGTTQNVLAAIKFDLKFCYILAGWEGSAHDSKVLNNVLSRPDGLRIPEGKYFLADSGYGIRNGIISPYRGVRYHLKEFGESPPQNRKELFNHRHSSLRTTVERGFGVLKQRFHVLDSEPFLSFQTQVKVVLVCCVVHNYIMGVDCNDLVLQEVTIATRNEEQREYRSQREEREEHRDWASKRDDIALAIWNDYIRSRQI